MTKKKVDNSSYTTTIHIGAGKFKQVAWYLVNTLFFKNALSLYSPLKIFLLKLFGARVGQGVLVKPGVNIKYPWKLTIGNYCWIGEAVWIDNLSEVVLGDNVTLSQGALLLTGSHDYSRTTFDFLSSGIILEEGVWIGAKAIVLGGVTCKSHSILGVSAVASKDLQPYLIYHGNPAVPIMERILR